ncbi:MAG: hypothetical protein AAB573_02660 [Patescibacteria group bacterium]
MAGGELTYHGVKASRRGNTLELTPGALVTSRGVGVEMQEQGFRTFPSQGMAFLKDAIRVPVRKIVSVSQ